MLNMIEGLVTFVAMTMVGAIIICFAIPGDREIKALTVKCDNEENGCDWVGELRQLSDHTSKCEVFTPTMPALRT